MSSPPASDPSPDQLPLQRPGRLSPSGASSFEQCAKKWRWRYIEHLADPPGEAAMIGSFAHRVLELLMQLPSPDRTQAAAKSIASREWPSWETGSDYTALDLDSAGTNGFKWKAWEAIERLWLLEQPEGVIVEATEQDVKAELAGVPFRGIVDRLDVEAGELVVTDYKSGNAPSPRYQESRLSQVLLYAAAISESTGRVPSRARLLFLGEKWREVSVDVTPDRIDQVTTQLSETWAAIGTACEVDDFPTQTGPLCGWCPYLDMCVDGQSAVIKRTGSLPAGLSPVPVP